jgi:hypothetical protein
MKFFDRPVSGSGFVEETRAMFRQYRAYIESVKGEMPAGAWAYASAEWHYDYDDHRSPHDSWLESVVVSEPSSGARSEIRKVEITITLLGAYHDGHLILRYQDVARYELEMAPTPKSHMNGHGDLVVDEVLWSEETGLVSHELLFDERGRWRIEARDIEWRWVPLLAVAAARNAKNQDMTSNRGRYLELASMLEGFVGGKRSLRFANKIEGFIATELGEDEALEDLVSDLSQYRPEGGHGLLNETAMADRIRVALAELRERLRGGVA